MADSAPFDLPQAPATAHPLAPVTVNELEQQNILAATGDDARGNTGHHVAAGENGAERPDVLPTFGTTALQNGALGGNQGVLPQAQGELFQI
jgi:hypothetical protein